MNKKFLLLFIIGIFVFSIIARLVPHAPNFTPIAALALFAGVYASKISKWYLFAPLAAMLLSDAIGPVLARFLPGLHATGFYEPKTMAVVYASFFAIALIGFLARKLFEVRPQTVVLGTLAGSLLFYLTTNFAVWAFSGMYAPTFEGLMLSYTMALPFLKFTLLGDLFYVSLFFGAYEFAGAFLAKQKGRHEAALERIATTRTP